MLKAFLFRSLLCWNTYMMQFDSNSNSCFLQDLCEEGGILLLAHDIMKLPFCEDSYLMAVFSRLKSKVLSIVRFSYKL